jgi:hypothetical protein
LDVLRNPCFRPSFGLPGTICAAPVQSLRPLREPFTSIFIQDLGIFALLNEYAYGHPFPAVIIDPINPDHPVFGARVMFTLAEVPVDPHTISALVAAFRRILLVINLPCLAKKIGDLLEVAELDPNYLRHGLATRPVR